VEESATRPGRRRDLALCALVGGALAFSYWTYARLAPTRPSGSDYARAAAHVRGRFEPGDLVDLNPFWARRAQELLGDLPLAAFRRLDEEDLSRYRRVWLISLFGAERRPEVRRGLDARSSLLEERRFGGLDLRLYRLPEPARVLFDFREQLAQARVFVEDRGRRLSCDRWARGHWLCGVARWNTVGREIVSIGDEPRAVIWAHPVEWGVKTIEFEDVPLGRLLRLRAGFRDEAVRHGGAPATLAVEIDGREVARWLREGRPGWAALDVDTSAFGGGRRRVAFRVTTPADARRHFCFAAETRE
jgi:hypothetical protein